MFLYVYSVICSSFKTKDKNASVFKFYEESLELVNLHINFGSFLAKNKEASRYDLNGLIDKIEASESSGPAEDTFREAMIEDMHSFLRVIDFDSILNPFIWISDVFSLLKHNKLKDAFERICNANLTEYNRFSCMNFTNLYQFLQTVQYMNDRYERVLLRNQEMKAEFSIIERSIQLLYKSIDSFLINY